MMNRMTEEVNIRLLGVLGAVLIGVGGCAGEPQKPAATVTPDQVRSHADKAFEKLKQEEQGRGTDPTMPR
ncbi:MAG: hypothetical protein U0412_13940 [Nitrospira sp.]